MKLQQLRYFVEVVRNGLNVTEAARALYTSQPGVSHHIRLLEDELGFEVFVRRGKRLSALTRAGQDVLAIAERMIADSENLRRLAGEASGEASGDLVVAATYTQAHVALPNAVRAFMARHPKVRLTIQPCSPIDAAERVRRGEATLCLSTEVVGEFDDLVMFEGAAWHRGVIAPLGHPLLRVRKLDLPEIARYPLVTYDFAFRKGAKIQSAFDAARLTPRIVLTSTDPRIIKTYVSAGLGIGLIASIAFEKADSRRLRFLDARHLFESSVTTVGVHRNSYVTRYMQDFIRLVLPGIDRATIDATMAERSLQRRAAR
ncbi:MAG TPA: LysR substrate-binding domain-containing protein [Casimicrobiaceae bacterium]|nr:LysR substrate-binding domain-containing protein [Casimicrobiaceae bacterium]